MKFFEFFNLRPQYCQQTSVFLDDPENKSGILLKFWHASKPWRCEICFFWQFSEAFSFLWIFSVLVFGRSGRCWSAVETFQITFYNWKYDYFCNPNRSTPNTFFDTSTTPGHVGWRKMTLGLFLEFSEQVLNKFSQPLRDNCYVFWAFAKNL